MHELNALLYGLPFFFVASLGASFRKERISVPVAAIAALPAGLLTWFVLHVTTAELTFLPGNTPLFHILCGLVAALCFFLGLRYTARYIFGDFEFEFARRITFKHQRSISSLVVRLGIVSIMLGVAVMEIAASLVAGFQHEIQSKIIGFGGHVQIGHYLQVFDSEIIPLEAEEGITEDIDSMPNVVNIAPYIIKPAMLRSDIAQEGIILKGLDSTYNWDFFAENMYAGELPEFNTPKASLELMLSRRTAETLALGPDSTVFAYFFETESGIPRVRKFKVKGVYETKLEEFDREWAFCDLRILQRIWRWEPNQVMGYEVKLKTLENLELQTEQIEQSLAAAYEANPITELHSELFDWVNLQNQQVWIILAMMTLIAVINMISVILILILERTRTIGLLKTMGLSNRRVMGIFVSNAFFLILIGMILGNLLGLGLIASQYTFEWLRMDPGSYFVEVAPVSWVWLKFLWINLGVLVVCTVSMVLPSLIILRISPVRALRFE